MKKTRTINEKTKKLQMKKQIKNENTNEKWKKWKNNDKDNDKKWRWKMIKTDKKNDKCNDNQNDKKWKKYFKDFQCVAGSFCQNYSISLRQLPPFLVRVLLAISDTCKNSSKQFVARDGQVSSGAVSVYKRA